MVKQAAELLRDSHLNFYGNVEGNDIFKGTTDVVVCDGFVGNVTLKASEGLAKMISTTLRAEFRRNWRTRLAGLLAMPVLSAFKRRMDPRRYNGATLLGLKGVVVKSHGSAARFAFEHAIETASDEVRNNVLKRITDQIQLLQRVAACLIPAFSAPAAICLRASSPTPISKNWSRRTINGSSNAPASANAIFLLKANSPATSPSRRHAPHSTWQA